MCPTGLLALWTGGSKSQEAQDLYDDHTGESQKSTLRSPGPACLTSFAPLRRSSRSVRSVVGNTLSALLAPYWGMWAHRASHGLECFVNGDEDLGERTKLGHGHPGARADMAGFLGKQAASERATGERVRHAEPAGNARSQGKRWSLRQVGSETAGEQQAMRSGNAGSLRGQGTGGGPSPGLQLILTEMELCRLSRLCKFPLRHEFLMKSEGCGPE